MKVYDKLIRDKIPEVLESLNKNYAVKIVEGEELLPYLKAKLFEETGEFSKEPSVEELADILEVIEALAVSLGSNLTEVLEAKAKKQAERGGFTKGLILLEADE
jgi:predicted house-cleaning noncanonical NTP pyrophosphatase (MazG superfamily)